MKNLLFCLAYMTLLVPGLKAGVASPQNFQLVSFNAEFSQQAISLKWVAANEIDVNYFIIERSTDALKFDSVGYVLSVSATNAWQNTYWFSDSPPHNGLYYYRLKPKVQGTDCKTTRIVCVNFEAEDKGINLYPNPSNGAFTLNYSLNQDEKGRFTLLSLRGKKLAEYDLDSMNSSFSVSLNLDKGVYYGDLNLGNRSTRRFKIIIN